MRIEDLKVGDIVVVGSGGQRHYGLDMPYKILEVTKVTVNQITLSDGKRYLKRNGNEVGGGSYGYDYIRQNWSDGQLMTVEQAEKENSERKAESRRIKIANILRDTKWKEFSLETLEAIYKIVLENSEKEKDSLE